ncbi:MAG: hypothetical protein WC782_13650 [Methylococcaceae bacterium]|jgi:hypothetical protein
MRTPSHLQLILLIGGLCLMPTSDAADNPDPASWSTLIQLLTPLAIMALIVAAFLFYLQHVQKTFLETCIKEKQLALFFQCPAGLPEGTIRGVIALLIVTASLLFLALPKGQFPFPDVMGGILGTIIGFYFGARGQNKDSESTILQQAKAATSQRDAVINQQELGKTGALLDTISTGLDTVQAIASVLPNNSGDKYVDLAQNVKKGVDLAKGLIGEGKTEDALLAATNAKDSLENDGPLTDIVSNALKSFGATLGTLIPPAALITAIVAGTVKLTSIYYQKWKARILHMPFSPAAGLSLERVDDNTGFMLLQQSPLFRDAFKNQMDNPQFLKNAANDFISNAGNTAQLFEKYAETGGFTNLQQFEEGLDEFHRTAADHELETLITAREPTLFGNVGGYKQLLLAVDKLHQNPKALEDLDALVVTTEKLQTEDKPVASMINNILEKTAP